MYVYLFLKFPNLTMFHLHFILPLPWVRYPLQKHAFVPCEMKIVKKVSNSPKKCISCADDKILHNILLKLEILKRRK